jgi:5-formyltetrahydrofolate cyclo-ligase
MKKTAMRDLFENNTVWRKALRREMMSRRLALTAEMHAEFSAAIVAHLLAHLPHLATGVVAFCWPIKNEPDVRAALDAWRRQGGRAVLPVVVEEGMPLAFRSWGPGTVLVPDRYGIPAPGEGDWLVPDAILLPLNAFDGNGYRLGYGGGFFDRTLAALSPRPLAVGVGFEMNRVDSIRPEPHDQRLDWIVTEAGAMRIPNG